MPGVLDYLKDVAEDLVSLEVATLTNVGEVPVSLAKQPLPQADQDKVDAQTQELDRLRGDLVTTIATPLQDPDDETEKADRKSKIKSLKSAVKTQQKIVKDIEMALGLYDPKDTFSKMQDILGGANVQLVAYSRFEIEGDSIHYVNNNESLRDLAAFHKELVAASQESRKALFDTVMKLLRLG